MNLKNLALTCFTLLLMVGVSGCISAYKEEAEDLNANDKGLSQTPQFVRKEMWTWQVAERNEFPVAYDTYRGNNTCIIITGLSDITSIEVSVTVTKGNVTLHAEIGDKYNRDYKAYGVETNLGTTAKMEFSKKMKSSIYSLYTNNDDATLQLSAGITERFWKTIHLPNGGKVSLGNQLEGIIEFDFDVWTNNPDSLSFSLLTRDECLATHR